MINYHKFTRKIEKWADILINIIKDELVYVERYNFYVGHFHSNSVTITGRTIHEEETITIYYDAIYGIVERNYDNFVNVFRVKYPNRKIPTKEVVFRTVAITTLIHELLHMSQYIPVEYKMHPIFQNNYIHPFRYLNNTAHKKKGQVIIENSVDFQVIYVMMKYSKQLRDRLGIIIEGFAPVHFSVIMNFNKSLEKFKKHKCKEMSQDQLTIYIKHNWKTVLRSIYIKLKRILDKNYQFSKYKKVSKISYDSYILACEIMKNNALMEAKAYYGSDMASSKIFKFNDFDQCIEDYYKLKEKFIHDQKRRKEEINE